MSLTYQPFAETPELQELSHELHMNVPQTERAVSALAGAALIGAALARRGYPELVALFPPASP